MSQCKKYSDWLTDASSGELASGREPELLAHAVECDGCREAYDHARELHDFADQIDRGMESLVSGEPSSHFNSRLRARIAAEAATSRFNWLAWTPIAAGSIALAVLLIGFFMRTPRPNAPAVAQNPDVTSEPSHTANSATPIPMISATNRPPAMATSPRRRIGKRPRLQAEPEVLVEDGQLDAITEFVDAVRSGHVDGEKLLAAQQQANAPLEIKPMEFVPLSPPQPDVAADPSTGEPERSRRP